ncbi:uncharacterized protein METZ01_LOCUS142871 [marine metagenome]|uniref:Uncharacterized protein n=1 Tax=marine metagenome TaxID=408172 RepID=A0A381ZMQ1_9ZZZZ
MGSLKHIGFLFLGKTGLRTANAWSMAGLKQKTRVTFWV